MYNVSLDKIAQELGYPYKGKKDVVVRRVVFDSREVKEGDLFVAIRGERVDGHTFVGKAIESGAVGVVTREDFALENDAVGQIIAEDGQAFIQALGKWCRAQFQGPVIAITGSQGKTSTKDLMAQVCRLRGNVVVTKENQNNELGLPLTLTRLDEMTDFCIVEMGMTGFGEIDFLCQMAQPTHAIITGIGMVHAEFLGSQQGIARAKTELFKYLPQDGAVALRKKDETLLSPYVSECAGRVLWCDVDGGDGDVVCTSSNLQTDASDYECQAMGETFSVHLPFAGKHYISNALLVTAIARMLDIPVVDIQNGLGSAVSLSSNRMEMHELDRGCLLINDCYNANPDSMIATIDVLAGYKPRPTVACLGNMYELGQYEKEGHASVGRHLATKGIESLICLGALAEGIGASAIEAGMNPAQVFYVDTTKQMALLLKEYARDHSVILVKGSNSMHMTEVYKYIKNEPTMV
ncbi:MAG: UDP-N-acetylmuramoyl-tripeptide--D-alanyl-D-alanine ligase [Peptococcaceae bacterium]|nr:UDP-N-acetylmuramoyl-tripeptide--D-alanyl-D-alanine ligase [Peptococcaceae bacterium]